VTRKSFVRYWPVARKTAAVKRVIGISNVDSIVPEEMWSLSSLPSRPSEEPAQDAANGAGGLRRAPGGPRGGSERLAGPMVAKAVWQIVRAQFSQLR
jgi:hypothetical protein